jgi:hypothetical protein
MEAHFMKPCSKAQKVVAGFVALVFFLFSGVVVPAQAAMIGTAEILSAQDDDLARQKVNRFLEREDVVHHLQAWGVGAGEAQSRVDAMTQEEIRLLAAKIDQMPAGGDALGLIVLVSVVAFVTLIITDIIGVTDVFTFIKKR